MNICLDVDGVIADIQTELEIRLKKDHDISIPRDEWHTFLIEEQFPQVSSEWVMDQFHDPSFYLNAVPYEDAWFMVNKWFMGGHDVYLVTSRGPAHGEKTIELTERWLDEWEICYNKLYHSQKYAQKYETLLELKADIFVEDGPREARTAAEHGIKTFLKNHAYNLKEPHGDAIRIDSLYEIDKEVINVKETV